MTIARLEHINVTVGDARQTAERLCNLFDWKVRWEGPTVNGDGYTSHVGTDGFYLAIHSPNSGVKPAQPNHYDRAAALNHIGLVVGDIDAMEQRVIAAGYTPHLHADYEPGRRFYFDDADGLEFEIVSYD